MTALTIIGGVALFVAGWAWGVWQGYRATVRRLDLELAIGQEQTRHLELRSQAETARLEAVARLVAQHGRDG